MNITFEASRGVGTGAAAVEILHPETLAAFVDASSERERLARILTAEDFAGRTGQVVILLAPAGRIEDRLILAGLSSEASVFDAQLAGARLAVKCLDLPGDLALAYPEGLDANLFAEFVYGFLARTYRFDKYRSAPRSGLANLKITGCSEVVITQIKSLQVAVETVHIVRDLVNEPGNALPPLELAARIEGLCAPLGIAVEILDATKLAELGANLLLAVGQGSVNPPCMVVLRMQGEGTPIGLAGKGMTFDTGGIHIKPVAGMWEMKNDMAGAATIAASMAAMARLGISRPLVAALGLAENMASGSATRPGDVVRSLAGPYVEIRNTDCEGRLVLADCLTYLQQRFAPGQLIDVATLTYAVQVGLGPRYAGIYGNSRPEIDALLQSAERTGELVWPMPIDAGFHDELASDFADFLNWPGVTYGNASIAAAFLEKFVAPATPWLHIDIAGPAYAPKGNSLSPAGGTGFGLRMLVDYLAKTRTFA
ncbi:putative cytosol aminopeptidase [Devosia yakushimensis]|uniref:Probable cytosol aminopeptidase n=1 Tax=Devosia yakushimensis TaxID=470028 RepID=A0ABQ5UAD6_9HYPH|nr:M17 family peptidase N-terminal domain-containing protein [Devosia yakushimensis]GLQ08199.1 putative cytosol aminopeptidase [Devosia yakushimensis]